MLFSGLLSFSLSLFLFMLDCLLMDDSFLLEAVFLMVQLCLKRKLASIGVMFRFRCVHHFPFSSFPSWHVPTLAFYHGFQVPFVASKFSVFVHPFRFPLPALLPMYSMPFECHMHSCWLHCCIILCGLFCSKHHHSSLANAVMTF